MACPVWQCNKLLLPPLILLGILLLQVEPRLPAHQVVAQVVHQTHYSTHYLWMTLWLYSSFSSVIIFWCGSSNFRFTFVELLDHSPMQQCFHKANTAAATSGIVSSEVGNLRECWGLPTGRPKCLDCTDTFNNSLQNVVQTGFPLCQHVQRAGGRSIFACT